MDISECGVTKAKRKVFKKEGLILLTHADIYKAVGVLFFNIICVIIELHRK